MVFSKGHIPWNKDKKNVYTQEVLEQMSQLRMTPVDINEIVYLYEKGNSIDTVANLMGINHSIVQRRLCKLGITRDKGWANRGKKRNPESVRRGAEKLKRIMANPEWRAKYRLGENNPFYGKHHKPETIEAMKRKLSILLSGENNPQWRGGKSFEPYPPYFKKIIRHWVYLRDDYTCQECGIRHYPIKGRLVAHHIDSIKDNCSFNNLVTLCSSCHGKTAMQERWGIKEVVT